MIAPSLVDQIKQLLAEGSLSQRKIARLTGVSRGTVGAIASGKRREIRRSVRPWEEEPEEPAGPPGRCPSCGAVVYLPCRFCRVKKLMVEGRVRRRPHRPLEPLQLELADNHRARYERVRARRIEEERLSGKTVPAWMAEEKPWNQQSGTD